MKTAQTTDRQSVLIGEQLVGVTTKTGLYPAARSKKNAWHLIHGFAEKLGSITKCKVIFAHGARSGRRPWKSGVGKDPGGNTPDNGFWQSDGGLPSTPTGGSFRP